MNLERLISAIVRQTTVLVARLSTTGGVRSPLGRVADQVFVGLVEELERQGVGKKVVADMFGMALRSYQLTWESTILPQAFFVDFIGATGRPAELLGLPRAAVRTLTPGDASANPTLAFWLIYCVLLYGLVPRLLLA